jgi:hypothetical protein
VGGEAYLAGNRSITEDMVDFLNLTSSVSTSGPRFPSLAMCGHLGVIGNPPGPFVPTGGVLVFNPSSSRSRAIITYSLHLSTHHHIASNKHVSSLYSNQFCAFELQALQHDSKPVLNRPAVSRPVGRVGTSEDWVLCDRHSIRAPRRLGRFADTLRGPRSHIFARLQVLEQTTRLSLAINVRGKERKGSDTELSQSLLTDTRWVLGAPVARYASG